MYDFETLLDRRPMGSNKWKNMKNINPDVPENIVPFSIADMEFKNCPEIIDGLQKFLKDAILGYSSGSDEFFSSICNWMDKRHNWKISKDWIALATGVVPAITNVILGFSEPEDGIIVMTPVYFPFYESIERNNRKVIKNPLILQDGKYTIDFDDLEKKAKDKRNKILIFCSPHNPVGRVWTKEELEKVGKICLENDIILLSDEIHFDLIMPGYKHTVFATLSKEIEDICITCTSPSKTFNIAGMQVSAIIIKNEKMRKRFIEQMEKSGHFGLGILSYKTCELAYKYGEKWLEELLEVIDSNAKFVKEYLEKYIPKIKVFSLEGTYLQWWDCRKLGLTHKELSNLMTHKAFIFMDEGYMFGEEGKGFERINLACPKFVLIEALERLRKALK